MNASSKASVQNTLAFVPDEARNWLLLPNSGFAQGRSEVDPKPLPVCEMRYLSHPHDVTLNAWFNLLASFRGIGSEYMHGLL
jgi:hypothetical protein